MRVILIESVSDLGLPGDIVDVKNGYARNYLLPKRKAMIATENNVVELEHKKRIAQTRRAKVLDDLKIRCETLSGANITFKERVTDAGKLYGSVTSRRIADALAEQFGAIEAAWVHLPEPIKEPGSFKVGLKLGPNITGTIVVVVEGERAAEDVEAAQPAEAEGSDDDSVAGEDSDDSDQE